MKECLLSDAVAAAPARLGEGDGRTRLAAVKPALLELLPKLFLFQK